MSPSIESMEETTTMLRDRLYRPGPEGSSRDFLPEDLAWFDEKFGLGVVVLMAIQVLVEAKNGNRDTACGIVNDLAALEAEGRFDRGEEMVQLSLRQRSNTVLLDFISLLVAVAADDMATVEKRSKPTLESCRAILPDEVLEDCADMISAVLEKSRAAKQATQNMDVSQGAATSISNLPKLNTTTEPSSSSDIYSPTFTKNIRGFFTAKKKPRTSHRVDNTTLSMAPAPSEQMSVSELENTWERDFEASLRNELGTVMPAETSSSEQHQGSSQWDADFEEALRNNLRLQ
jgi:hypothetical protein